MPCNGKYRELTHTKKERCRVAEEAQRLNNGGDPGEDQGGPRAKNGNSPAELPRSSDRKTPPASPVICGGGGGLDHRFTSVGQ